MIDFDTEARLVANLEQSHITLKRQLLNDEAEVTKAKVTHVRTLEAQEVLQRMAQGVQEQTHNKLSDVVSSCLRTVFDDPYEFKIKFERKRGKTEAQLVFTRRGLEIYPLTAAGGGMVDVAAFALRVSCLMLHRPKLSKIVVIDEGFKFVSAKYRDNVRLMLEGLAKDLGLQIIQVSHIPELQCGTVIEL